MIAKFKRDVVLIEVTSRNLHVALFVTADIIGNISNVIISRFF